MFKFLSFAIVKAAYDYTPLVPMEDYSSNLRTLDCWECFESRGKVCSSRNNTSIIQITGSSNFGHAVCCKPEYNGDMCHDDQTLVCSEPAKDDSGSQSWMASSSIESAIAHLNYLFFAFCPMVTRKNCGIDDSLSNNMTLVAGLNDSFVAST